MKNIISFFLLTVLAVFLRTWIRIFRIRSRFFCRSGSGQKDPEPKHCLITIHSTHPVLYNLLYSSILSFLNDDLNPSCPTLSILYIYPVLFKWRFIVYSITHPALPTWSTLSSTLSILIDTPILSYRTWSPLFILTVLIPLAVGHKWCTLF